MTARERLTELFGIDVRSLAVFRMALGALLLIDVLTRAQDLVAHYTDAGVLPPKMLYARWWTRGYWSLHLLDGGPAWQGVLFALAAGCAVALMLGYRTRWVAFASWVLLCSLHTRNPLVLQAGDSLMRMVLFFGMFLPLGAVWSVDRWRHGGPAPQARVAWLGTAALLLQVCMVYWFTVLIRLGTPVWWDGSALYWALEVDAYVRPLGAWLSHQPSLLAPLTWIAILFEALGPFLAFVPWRTAAWRTLAVALFCAMHLVFGATLNIGLFWAISMTSWLVFLPTESWEALARRVPRLDVAVRPGVAGAPHWSASVGVGVCLAFVVAWNVRTLDLHHAGLRVTRVFPPTLNVVPDALRLDQYWNMYSPPTRDDGWVIAEATLDDGSTFDLLTGEPVDRSRPADIAARYPRQRWRKYLFTLWRPRNALSRRPYAAFLRDRWNDAHPDGPAVEKIRLIWMRELSRRPEPDPPTERVLGSYELD